MKAPVPAPAQAEAVKPQPAPAIVAPVKVVEAMKAPVPAPTVKPVLAVVESAPNKPAKPEPEVVASVTVASAPPPGVPAQVNEVKPMTKPVAAPSVDSSTKTAVLTPAPASPQPVAAPVSPITAAKQPELPPITIRRAILPSKEEIDRMKQGQVENRTGQMPAISTAAPLSPKRKAIP
jgi:hypothetical protein